MKIKLNRTVNLKALAILLAGAVALGVGTHFAHAYQVKRNARSTFEQAEQAQREGQVPQALEYLENYLGLERDDTDARARYGLLLRGEAKTPPAKLRAFLALEQALQRGCEREDVRRAAAELCVDFRRFTEAREGLTALLQAHPDDADLMRWLGLCELRARQLFPDDARFGRELAALEIHEGHKRQALEQLRPSLEKPPETPQDLWATAGMLIDLGEMDKAEPLIRRLEDGPTAAAAGYLRGRLRMRQGAWGEARVLLERALTTGTVPPDLGKQVQLALAECHARLGNPDQQAAACRAALKIDRQWVPARRYLAPALAALGKLDEAAAEYRALVAGPQPPAAGDPP